MKGENDRFAANNEKLESEVNRLGGEVDKMTQENEKFSANNKKLEEQVGKLEGEVIFEIDIRSYAMLIIFLPIVSLQDSD